MSILACDDGEFKVRTKAKTEKSPDLFESWDFRPVNRPLIINKSKIMGLTEELKREDSLASLRNAVFRLECNLRSVKEDKAGVLNIDSNGDTITISQRKARFLIWLADTRLSN